MNKVSTIYNYDNYRLFIKDIIKSKGHSVEGASDSCGFKSKSYLSGIINGKKDLSYKTNAIKNLCVYLNLNGDKSKYFINLIKFNQADNENDRLIYFEKLLKTGKNTFLNVKETEHEYYSNWYNVVIKDLLDTINFRDNYTSIQNKLFKRVSINQIKKSIELLKRLDLVKENELGFLKPTSQFIISQEDDNADRITSTLNDLSRRKTNIDLLNIQKEIFQSGDKSLYLTNHQTLGLSKGSLSRIKNLIKNFKLDVQNVIADSKNEKSEAVYNISLNFYRLSEKEI